jgi:hypothetical protein
MKTNVVLKSTDRNIFGVNIKQQTNNSFLSITDLQNAYEKARWMHGWKDKRISDIMQSKDSKERIFHILKERDLVKTDISAFMEMVDNEGLTKVLKGLGLYKTTGRGENRSTYADPYVWTLLAMELNPLLYAKVVMWLTDSLIFDRLEAGSEYKPMNSEINNIIEAPKYHIYAKEINKKVFGQHISGMRNLASAKELRKIADIEKYITKSIQQQFIKSEEQIITAIQNY